MDNIFIIISIIFLGYIFSFFQKQKESVEMVLNEYLYYVALPITIFLKTATIKLSVLNISFVLINSIPVLLVFLLIYIFWRLKIFQSNFSRTLIITSTLGNLIYLGLSIISIKEGESMIGPASLAAAIQNFIIFTIGIFLINKISDYEETGKIILYKVIKNPLFISSIFGVLFAYFSIPLSFFEKIMNEFAKSTTALSLFVIGVSLYGKRILIVNIKKILIISFFKHIFLPLIVFLFIYFGGLSDIEYKIVFIQYTMPVAIACYVIAYEFNLETDIVSQSIFFTTILYFMLYSFYDKSISFLF